MSGAFSGHSLLYEPKHKCVNASSSSESDALRNDGCEGVHFNRENHARGQNLGGTVPRNASGSHLSDLHKDGKLSKLLGLRDVSDDEFVKLMKNAPPA